MKVRIPVPTEVNLKPGDSVVLNTDWPVSYHFTTRIKRMVETKNGVYAVFDNDTWRPLSTCGQTWKRVGD